MPERTSVLERICISLRSRTRRAEGNGPIGLFRLARRPSNAPDRESPGAPGLEQLVRVDLVRPTEEVRRRVVLRGAVHGGAVGGRPEGVERLAAFDGVDPRLRLLGDRSFLVPAWHGSDLSGGTSRISRMKRAVLIALCLYAGAAGASADPGHRVVVATADGSVTFLDGVTRRVIRVFHGFSNPADVELSQSGHVAYVLEKGRGTLDVINLDRLLVVRRVRAGARPNRPAVGDNLIWIAHESNASSLTRIQIGRPDVRTFAAGGPVRELVRKDVRQVLWSVGFLGAVAVIQRERITLYQSDGRRGRSFRIAGGIAAVAF